jgi:hypothetical protein
MFDEKLKYDTPFRNFSKPSPDRTIRLIENIPLESLKVPCRKNKISVNFFVHALMSQTIKEYIVRHGDTKTDKVVVNSSFSNRDFQRNGGEIVIRNDFVGQMYALPLLSDLDEAIKASKELGAYLVGGTEIKVQQLFSRLFDLIPEEQLKPVFCEAATILTLLYSNMPMPKLDFNGTRILGATGFAPLIGGGEPNSIVLGTVDQNCTIGLTTCTKNIKNPDEFIQIFKDKIAQATK